MTAAMLVLEPIFEADLPPEQYAYRPGRNAQQAVVEVGALLYRGHPEVVDAKHRIGDRRIIRLIQKWLKAGLLEDGRLIEIATELARHRKGEHGLERGRAS